MRTIARIFLAVSLLSTFFGLYLQIHYANTLPREPNPEVGRILDFSYRGRIVFLTWTEQLTLDLPLACTLGFGIFSGLLFLADANRKKWVATAAGNAVAGERFEVRCEKSGCSFPGIIRQ
jgi:hypothetical protein